MTQERFSPAGRPRATAAIAALKMIAPKKPDRILMFGSLDRTNLSNWRERKQHFFFALLEELEHIGSDGSRESLDEE